ncbi:PUA-like domain-containing protein [Neurospora tetraspora]|uniref:PUA-like domain-containing protein n=1 Tax=Neurospora tetraspora TaxID=94610 RepID=A0AAE0JHY7_9PEZI|nr:PUA-like domain-containing protein [Neurospora tetraspora]
MISKNRGRTGSLSQNRIKKSSDKQRIRPAPKLKLPSEAVSALPTISSAPQVQTRVPVADMESPGEPSGQILTSRSSNLPSNATPTQLPSPVTDNDTDKDVEMAQPTVEATPADENTASVWVDSVEEGWKQLKKLLSMTKKRPDHAKKLTEEEIQSYIRNMRVYLFWLQHEVEPKPEFKKLGLDKVLAFYLPPDFPETLDRMAPDLSLLAQEVLNKYEAEEWGKGFTDHEEEEGLEADNLGSAVATSSKKGRQSPDPRSSAYTEVIQLPPASHPVWGLRGIMHGLARKTTETGRAVLFLDPRYHHEKRKAKVFGHNDHIPGAWWPYQKAAHFHGAHGAPQAGITGHADLGAYSIVVSANSVYRDLNEDKGTELWYSADKSTNANPLKAETSNATRSLEISLKKGKPVRVLRHAGTTSDARRSPIYPTVGIRYDGLYKVVAQGFDTNKNNGVYKKFKLERLPDSENDGRSWEDVQKYPTREQRQHFDKIKDGY